MSAQKIIDRLRPSWRACRSGHISAARSGHPHRRPAVQRAIPIHAAGRDHRGPAEIRPAPSTELRQAPGFADVNTDQQNHGLQALLTYDRPTAARLGVTPQMIDNTLYHAFGQSEVSTIYTPLNQYYVIMEVAPKYWQSPEGLHDTYLIPNTGGGAIPLDAVASTRLQHRRWR